MKKVYTQPILSCVAIGKEDVIACSGLAFEEEGVAKIYNFNSLFFGSAE